ncbi:hypothetical protein SEA_VINCENZO_65 [Mycobacterium phage Vincenzo]|uniref:Uncharacterized protein n=1 Tax=Mycobacterium phage Vincenzo TaxID=1647301 RepID=A0A0F6SJJ5_9CAUD|nr:hypothetical protein SEA_VINCENZO_65 [Mycobacterium phage Vincenzo]AKF14327.1 hypothetical protein SEA_VINCENZO_65 [Mycobacterium phage Vincenzo]
MAEGGAVAGPGPADDDSVAAMLSPGATVWTGLPVTCTSCHNAGMPVMGQDGWQLPVHGRVQQEFPFGIVTCPGSMTPVTAMQTPQAMTDRIEQHVVDAMPPRINEEYDTP